LPLLKCFSRKRLRCQQSG